MSPTGTGIAQRPPPPRSSTDGCTPGTLCVSTTRAASTSSTGSKTSSSAEGRTSRAWRAKGWCLAAPVVADAAALAVPDDVMGEKVGAVLYSDGARVDLAAVIGHCCGHLAEF